jgi:membrane protein YqaA with SNARE-associated domain
VAASGDLSLALIIPAAAVGAFLGDNTVYLIGRRFGGRVTERFFSGEKATERMAWAEVQLSERGGELIVIARFIPGGRTAVALSAGRGISVAALRVHRPGGGAHWASWPRCSELRRPHPSFWGLRWR